jgi:glutamate dehydrogenase (NADP+)
VISFRVCWEDDKGNIRVQRGWRVQNNNAIGPYKGGIRFHPSVTESVLKFLAFEQTFKNALTGLPMGGGKGGSNFNPEGQVRQRGDALLPEPDDRALPPHRRRRRRSRPATSAWAREIGYMFGQYKRLTNEFTAC